MTTDKNSDDNFDNNSLNLTSVLTLNLMFYHRHALRLKHASPAEFTKIFKQGYREISSALKGPKSINQKLNPHIQKRDHLNK